MKKKNDFDTSKNYYKELQELDKAISLAVTEFDANIVKKAKEDMITEIKQYGSDKNQSDMMKYLIESGNSKAILENEGIILERRIPFDPDEFLRPNENYNLGCFDKSKFNYDLYTAYFKFFNDRSIADATKVARITFLNPSYIHHNDPMGKEEWKLSSNERSDLNSILHRVKYGQTIWYWLTYEFYVMSGLDLDFGTTVPNYNTILPDVNKELSKDDNTNIKNVKRNRGRR